MPAPTTLHEFRIKVSCERCKYVQRLERTFTQPARVHVICHNCELPMVVDVPSERFVAAQR